MAVRIQVPASAVLPGLRGINTSTRVVHTLRVREGFCSELRTAECSANAWMLSKFAKLCIFEECCL